MDQKFHNIFQSVINKKGLHMGGIYEAMRSNDLSDVVFAIKDVIQKCGSKLNINKRYGKCESTSNKLREGGNDAFRAGNYQLALEFYNKALAYAPKHSRPMQLALSNRSQLLLKNTYYAASLKDIECCLAMGCPKDLENKLLQRMATVSEGAKIENCSVEKDYIGNFFKTHSNSNPDIPCATTDITIIEDSGSRKIVTTKDIQVGTVLAQETAFTTMVCEEDKYFACYYCNCLSMNLMPCEGCCQCLFCSEVCETQCMEEWHSLECQIIDKVSNSKIHIAFKSALKIKKMCDTWDEFITASYRFGADRIQNSTNMEIYNVNEKFSLLCNETGRIFIYGELYLCGLACVEVLHFLEDVSFLPAGQKKKHNALCALLRITMYLALHAPPLVIVPMVHYRLQDCVQIHKFHYGSFSFMGKLKHSCHPNCIVVCLNNRAALVALKHIEPGTELTITQFDPVNIHQNLTTNKEFKKKLFELYGEVCDCVCTHDIINKDQKKMVKELNLTIMSEFIRTNEDISEVYPKLCRVLMCLDNVLHTEEYQRVYEQFLLCISRVQNSLTRNVAIDANYFFQ